MSLILPTTNKQGKPKLSYSQYKLWKEDKGFNTGLLGKYEYIRKYFLKEEYEDAGFGLFGTQVQEYIQERKHTDLFDENEKKTLDSIEPLDVFEHEFELDLGGFVVQGFIDDMKKDHSKYRDYKTASKKSKDKYYQDDYEQLDIYGLYSLKVNNFIPVLELCIIERNGNAFTNGRNALKVGENVWWHEVQADKSKLEKLETELKKVAQEISEYYQTFQKVNQ